MLFHLADPGASPSFVVDFILTYRTFLSSKAVFDVLASRLAGPAAIVSLTPEQGRIVQILTFWAAVTPFVIDVDLCKDTAVLEAMQALLLKLPADAPAVQRFKATLAQRAAVVLYPPLQPQPVCKLRVALTAPFDSPEFLDVPIVEHSTLSDVRTWLCEYICDVRKIAVQEADFEFRAHGFASVLPDTLAVAAAHLSSVHFHALKATTATTVAEMIDEDYVACQLTYLDHSSFCRIVAPHELFTISTEDGDPPPGVYAVAQRFNQITWWAMSLIFSQPTETSRIAVIQKLIDVAHACYGLHNFHTSAALVNALKQPAVTRLKKTWSLMDRVHLSVFACLERLVLPDSNRKKYREMLRTAVAVEERAVEGDFAMLSTSEPCLPFLATTCSDFAFCDLGNKSLLASYVARELKEPSAPVDKVMLVNFGKRRQLSRLLQRVMAYQAVPYEPAMLDRLDLATVPFVEHFFKQHVQEVTREEANKLSRQLEPDGSVDASQLPLRAVQRRMLMYRAVDEYKRGLDDDDTDLDGDLDALATPVKRAARRINFLESFDIRSLDVVELDLEVRKRMQHNEARKKIKEVMLEMDRNDVTVTSTDSRGEHKTKYPIEKVTHYRFIPLEKILYFTTENFAAGTKTCHVFFSHDNRAEQCFLSLHRSLNRWSRSSMKNSEEARRIAMDKLASAPNGAFVVRDSTSRPGAFALSVKFAGKYYNILIENVAGRGFTFKDSSRFFSSLEELIVAHCLSRSGLPCCLTLEGSQYLTDRCMPISSNAVIRPGESPRAAAGQLQAPVEPSRLPGRVLFRDSIDGGDEEAAGSRPTGLHHIEEGLYESVAPDDVGAGAGASLAQETHGHPSAHAGESAEPTVAAAGAPAAFSSDATTSAGSVLSSAGQLATATLGVPELSPEHLPVSSDRDGGSKALTANRSSPMQSFPPGHGSQSQLPNSAASIPLPSPSQVQAQHPGVPIPQPQQQQQFFHPQYSYDLHQQLLLQQHLQRMSLSQLLLPASSFPGSSMPIQPHSYAAAPFHQTSVATPNASGNVTRNPSAASLVHASSSGLEFLLAQQGLGPWPTPAHAMALGNMPSMMPQLFPNAPYPPAFATRTPFYYFHTLDREQSEELLRRSGNSTGMFVVRPSRNQGQYALSTVGPEVPGSSQKEIIHHLITTAPNGVFIDGVFMGQTVDELVGKGQMPSDDEKKIAVTLTLPPPGGQLFPGSSLAQQSLAAAVAIQAQNHAGAFPGPLQTVVLPAMLPPMAMLSSYGSAASLASLASLSSYQAAPISGPGAPSLSSHSPTYPPLSSYSHTSFPSTSSLRDAMHASYVPCVPTEVSAHHGQHWQGSSASSSASSTATTATPAAPAAPATAAASTSASTSKAPARSRSRDLGAAPPLAPEEFAAYHMPASSFSRFGAAAHPTSSAFSAPSHSADTRAPPRSYQTADGYVRMGGLCEEGESHEDGTAGYDAGPCWSASGAGYSHGAGPSPQTAPRADSHGVGPWHERGDHGQLLDDVPDDSFEVAL